jgi:hypothetical protein
MEGGIQKVKRKSEAKKNVPRKGKNVEQEETPLSDFVQKRAIKALFPGDSLCQVRDNRQFETFSLIGLDHKKNPENK